MQNPLFGKEKKINTSEDEFNAGMEAKHIMACC